MQSAHQLIKRSSTIERTSRVMQVEGMFDLDAQDSTEQTWQVNLELPAEWNVGLIVGASGAGKSTVARELFGEALVGGFDWHPTQSVLDGFPDEMGIKDVTELLSAVGFSSPPAWLRPFHTLSNGEQFRVTVARALAERPELVAIDEFTSVVDRTVAQIGSAAIAKLVRRRGGRFVAVACHYDIIEWLEPDWIYQPATGTLNVGRTVRRPAIELQIRRVHHSAWELFRKHHYLSHELNKASACFVAFWQDTPVAFSSILPFPHPRVKNMRREHRVVCLPDYQGVGIGNRMSAYMGALCKAFGWRYTSTTSHPAMIRARNASPEWSMTKAPALNPKEGKNAQIRGSHATDRLSAAFEYIGAALPLSEAVRVWGARENG